MASGTHSVHGLQVAAADLVYSWDTPLKTHLAISEDSIAVLHDLQDVTHPSPLQRFPPDPINQPIFPEE